MNEGQKTALRIGLRMTAGALVMGTLADSLLRTAEPGINILLLALALLMTIALLARFQPDGWSGEGRWLALAWVLCAGAFAWRDSPTLHVLDTLALLVCLGLTAGNLRHEPRLAQAGLTDYARGVMRTGFQSAFGGLALVFRDIPWGEVPRGNMATRRLTSVGTGLAVALPPLLLFGSLFAAADPIFSHFAHQAFDWNFADIGGHLALSTIGSLLTGGFLRALFTVRPRPFPAKEGTRATAGGLGPTAPFLTLGTVEIGVALGLLDLLFLAFVLVQLRFFFGGARMVQVTAGLTYAQYARSGFFEMVTVAALVLPLLLILHWMHRPDALTGERIFQALAALQIGLLFVIMVSAVQRMRLYQGEYGQTELRLYTTAFMTWLTLVFLWFIATVLRGHRERFALGALLAGLCVIGGLHLLNPDAVIVRTNAELARADHAFDLDYALSLSADAVPALIAARPLLPPQQSQAVSVRVKAAWTAPRPQDWRSWNWSRVQARRLASEQQDTGNAVSTAK